MYADHSEAVHNTFYFSPPRLIKYHPSPICIIVISFLIRQAYFLMKEAIL